MGSKTDNLNVDIFCALKASEVSGVKPLILSNPGAGKSTTVELFAKVRGYEVVLLRGNSTTPEEIMGYDVAPRDVTYDKPMAAIHLRPSWFEEVLRHHEKGEKVLLFLDEITTANEFVQAALLHLIFERMVGRERLPDDTLIVAAGNYAGNLTTTMSLLPPVMNRFMIYNIAADHTDLDVFLNRYEGAIASADGKCNDYMKTLSEVLTKMDGQERKVSPEMRNKIGEYIEKSIKDTTRMLITTQKDIDLTVTDLRNIYSDSDDDTKVYGFVSFRTLNYLRDLTIAWYLCFGKAGINSKNYRNAVDGLCGIGVTKPKGSTDIKVNRIGKAYYDAMVQTSNELEKLDNDRLPEYTKFFIDITKSGGELGGPEINALTNKLKELNADKEIENIDRPIDEALVEKICQAAEKTASKFGKMKVSTDDSITDVLSVTDLTNTIVTYNQIVDLVSALTTVTGDSKRNYANTTTKITDDTVNNVRQIGFRIRSFAKIMKAEQPSLASVIPQISTIS